MMTSKEGPKNDLEALILALKLAITAPDEKSLGAVTPYINNLAERLGTEQVELAKQIAQMEVGNVESN
tara:strand:+ start:606 stop:809 length:204 start_codon:yes stop_codon:yes gene_type:complete